MAGRDDPTERPPPRAFVIEDDVQTLALLTDLAEMCGFEPVSFTRISSARAALRERVPTVMVVDDDLPDGRGGDLVTRGPGQPAHQPRAGGLLHRRGFERVAARSRCWRR